MRRDGHVIAESMPPGVEHDLHSRQIIGYAIVIAESMPKHGLQDLGVDFDLHGSVPPYRPPYVSRRSLFGAAALHPSVPGRTDTRTSTARPASWAPRRRPASTSWPAAISPSGSRPRPPS